MALFYHRANGTLANFPPVRAVADDGDSLRAFLQGTQDALWAVTEHGNVGLDEVYNAAGLDRAAVGNRTLFLFQPFEPSGAEDGERWLVMAKSRVRMIQPYGLVVELTKAVGEQRGAYRLTVMYDENLFTAEAADGIAGEMAEIVEVFIEHGQEGGRVLEEL